ncbi:Methyltransferase domain-containing protein [Halogranum rubrum]|uniref:Methyltransferase domain-containing protein n=1 Tax=Halogranum rubrum TaxID=553466 RepID=A0A1I4ERD2_9EURY|nr:class I SAM-dependent methyltransferase [Halogranum rubrum]SFL07773.1 Methyltransferase domain-containing protein [Halogranum rubrum]
MESDPRQTYDRIAAHFASTREYAWPEVETFVDEWGTARQRALDLGCGNGRHAELLADHVQRVVGLDLSRGLLTEAQTRATERGFAVDLVHGDAACLPFVDDGFDLAVYVATLHHLQSRDARVASLSELARVLTPEGRAVVSVWSTAHDTFDAEHGFDTTVDWTLPGGETVPRYYHIYDPEEFRTDLDASDLTVVETFVSSGNCYAVVGGH